MSLETKLVAFRDLVALGEQRGHLLHDQPVSELAGGARVVIGGRAMAMFASYSYLGLVGDPRVNQATHEAIERYGTATHGSRMLAGALELHHSLERELADFKRREGAVTFTSGFAANVSTIAALVGPDDLVVCDKLDHASIVDGAVLSGATLRRFKHGDMDHLEWRLKNAKGYEDVLVVVDAVFSMDGDIIDLPSIVEICKRYSARLMVDEAHSLGVLGATGRGIEEHFGLDATCIDVSMGTLSKAIPSSGGFVAGASDLMAYLRHTARSAVYSGSLAPPQTAAALAGLRVLISEPERVRRLQQNADYFRGLLASAGVDLGNSRTPIVPVMIGNAERAYDVASECQRRGVFVMPIVSPTVPVGAERLRATVTAAHSPSEIEAGARTIADLSVPHATQPAIAH